MGLWGGRMRRHDRSQGPSKKHAFSAVWRRASACEAQSLNKVAVKRMECSNSPWKTLRFAPIVVSFSVSGCGLQEKIRSQMAYSPGDVAGDRAGAQRAPG